MSKSALTVVGSLFLAFALFSAPLPAAEHYLGGGVRWLQTIDDIEIDDVGAIDTDGSSIILSYQVDPAGLFKFELDLEYLSGLGEALGDVISPQFLVLVGGNLYGGAGVGIYYFPDEILGNDTSSEFFLGRLGLQLTLLPKIHLDLNANYQTDTFGQVFDGADSDSITLGAMVRFRIN